MGQADDCPFGGALSFVGHFLLVRDETDPSLLRLNEIFRSTYIALLLGPSLPRVFQWREEDADLMERLIVVKQDMIRIHDSFRSLMNNFRSYDDESDEEDGGGGDMMSQLMNLAKNMPGGMPPMNNVVEEEDSAQNESNDNTVSENVNADETVTNVD